MIIIWIQVLYYKRDMGHPCSNLVCLFMQLKVTDITQTLRLQIHKVL
jgi:hypothetical protein